jgi:hypothetical protein
MTDPAKGPRASRTTKKTTKKSAKKATKKTAAGQRTTKKLTKKVTKKAASGNASQQKSQNNSGQILRGGRGRTVATVERRAPRPEISGPEWQRMIAEAAYFKALNRGFAGGSPERDWAEAEAEVRAKLDRPS